jgi:hypothetical protein
MSNLTERISVIFAGAACEYRQAEVACVGERIRAGSDGRTEHLLAILAAQVSPVLTVSISSYKSAQCPKEVVMRVQVSPILLALPVDITDFPTAACERNWQSSRRMVRYPPSYPNAVRRPSPRHLGGSLLAGANGATCTADADCCSGHASR